MLDLQMQEVYTQIRRKDEERKRIMKKKKCGIPIMLLALIVLTACSGKKSENAKRSTEDSQEITSLSQATVSQTEEGGSEEASSTSQSDAEPSKDASFNGSYYSVQGKYGPIIIVNKKHPLVASYAPGEDPTAQAAFVQLRSAMQAAGFAVSDHYSGFRSYETQEGLYNSYVARDGQANADRYSARPGYSEHQTGLAFDLLDSAGNLLEEPNAVNWLAQHAHEYGFVVRYIAGKESVTGYMPETWHIRYIGQEASDIYKSGLTLEEYFGIAGGDY